MSVFAPTEKPPPWVGQDVADKMDAALTAAVDVLGEDQIVVVVSFCKGGHGGNVSTLSANNVGMTQALQEQGLGSVLARAWQAYVEAWGNPN